MPGVVFIILVPTANFEKTLALGNNALDDDENNVLNNCIPSASQQKHQHGVILTPAGNNLNINQPEYNTAVLRLEVELRDKNDRQKNNKEKRGYLNTNNKSDNVNNKRALTTSAAASIPMEKVLEELLRKLNIEHVTWTIDKNSNYIQVIFPLQSGERCETTLHCLTELGIGINLNSNISVLPCSVRYDAIKDLNDFDEFSYEHDTTPTSDEYSKWNNFVESIKSKLTVKQVVDGVRAGGSLSFDYILLIVTADSLAALGLVENNAPNIVAAMLVSPLMGPVMSITFGAIISDRELMKVGFISLGLGIFISILFGFIFGLILGTTEQPWGFGDWPTEEMKGRGNARSLWMGILWALTSGTGVAVALLQGSAGPLIGVAISASLLPPVVNCGLFWALACIWLIYDGVKIPHIKGEAFTGNTTYIPIYTNYIPVEFLINGIVSALLTVINVICIFITAIIVLKIKEVAAPYTSSPDLRRFWETDIRAVRKTNRSTMRRKTTATSMMTGDRYDGKIPQHIEDVLNKTKNNANLGQALEQAIREAVDDETYQKVKRVSYASQSVGELVQRLQLNSTPSGNNNNGNSNIVTNGLVGQSPGIQNSNAIHNSKMTADLASLDKLITSLLLVDRQTTSSPRNSVLRKHLRRSLRLGSVRKSRTSTIATIPGASNDNQTSEYVMPTIPETGRHISDNTTVGSSNDTMATAVNLPSVRRVLNTIANASHRLSQSIGNGISSTHQRNNGSEEHINLTMENIHDLNNLNK